MVIGAVAYTLSAYSWMTNSFVSKDTLTILVQKVDSIDRKLDMLLDAKVHGGSE